MAEPMVSVPVSKLREWAVEIGAPYPYPQTRAEIEALLPQPTPTAEFRPAPDGWFTFGSHVGYEGPLEFSDEKDEAGDPLWERHTAASTASPPRIADMAPGTTFEYGERWIVGNHVPGQKPFAHRNGLQARYLTEFDTSTIRDVTPPAEAA